MENIKQRLSDVAHNWSYIGMITLFLFCPAWSNSNSSIAGGNTCEIYSTTKERNLREVQHYCVQAF